MIGIVGLVWIAMVLMTTPKLKLIDPSSATKARLYTARHYLGGAIIALFVALYTQRLERGVTERTGSLPKDQG
jgi:hypothetical protein